MDNEPIAALREALQSAEHECAWTKFLKEFSPVILQMVRRSIWDADLASDCFVFVCERLHEHKYRRLLRFRPDSGVRFETWLRVVVRNLCVDWYRKQSGRWRVFEAIKRLPWLHGRVYRLRHEQGLSLAETVLALQAEAPGVSSEEVENADETVGQALKSRQSWILSNRASQAASITAVSPELEEGEQSQEYHVGTGDSPESAAISSEQRLRLARALSTLTPAERIVVQLRFSQGVTLAAIARFAGLPDAQTADRRIRAVLDKLRAAMR